jgi:hypothetical protein
VDDPILFSTARNDAPRDALRDFFARRRDFAQKDGVIG